jgi:hypothetical protein
MASDLNLNDILMQIAQLDKKAQLILFEKIAILIHKNKEDNKPIKLSSISGIGSTLCSNINIDDYLYQERQWY